MENNFYELVARYDSRASFYGKAHIIESGKNYILQSYNTKILQVDKKTNKWSFITKDKNDLTQTTCRHIREMLKQFTSDTKDYTRQDLIKVMNS